jgi:hypothetical protein
VVAEQGEDARFEPTDPMPADPESAEVQGGDTGGQEADEVQGKGATGGKEAEGADGDEGAQEDGVEEEAVPAEDRTDGKDKSRGQKSQPKGKNGSQEKETSPTRPRSTRSTRATATATANDKTQTDTPINDQSTEPTPYHGSKSQVTMTKYCQTCMLMQRMLDVMTVETGFMNLKQQLEGSCDTYTKRCLRNPNTHGNLTAKPPNPVARYTQQFS